MNGPARMGTPSPKRFSQRHQRAAALIALAAVVIAVAGFAYLRSTSTRQLAAVPGPVDPMFFTSTPVDYAFVTSSIGWASLVVVPSSEGGQFRVFRTVDGAKHWQQQLVGQNRPELTLGSYAPITVQFFGETHGFMTVGGPIAELYRTIDGGAHWASVPLLSLTIDAITFSDASNGWLSGSLTSTTRQMPRLFVTHDAGDSWTGLPDPPADAAGLSFRRPTEAWMGSFGAGPPHVYTSSDAGQSWLPHDLPAPTGGSWAPDRYFPTSPTRIQLVPRVGAIASVEAIRCVAASTSSQTTCANATSEIFLFRSADGGNTWKQVPPPPGVVAYQDSVHWWATSPNALFKSMNAGQSWKQVATIPPDRRFSVPGVLDSTHAWASIFVMSGFGLALTNDGGLRWTLASVPRPA
jgi:photosystem II stability/assembly factor-like uncharacterized protein